ncbi:hypothetical protein [Streptomyces coffeae]|uniref:Integral membrane protein n=1 Tax=Streptomyces coffeae TaxID=621382 RepID=A0ABS1NNZ3_9ACTN|nr:hypothetical protein [Streptomyces coffeae]MBL1101811.1 hypothetical protein [Streptomyces coffeae]
MGVIARTVTTVIGTAHLCLLAFLSGAVAYRTGDAALWAMPLSVLSSNAFIALSYGHWEVPRTLHTCGVPPLVLFLSTASAMAFSQPHGVARNLITASVWAAVLAAGLFMLTTSVRAWGEQVRYADPAYEDH